MARSFDILPSHRKRTGTMALLVVVVAAAAGWWLGSPLRADAQSPRAVRIEKVATSNFTPAHDQLIFVAVLGSDARTGPPDAGGGCDAVHIVAVNPAQRSGTVLNFPRDAYLEGRKITDTCRRSGFDAAVDILRRHTGLPIQYLVRTEFSHFMRFIDELGGVAVEVPYAMNDEASGARFAPGVRHMNGGDVLAFSRNRKSTPNGDFSRSENQGRVIIASLHKYRAESADPHRILDYIKAAQRHVRASIPVHEMLKLALIARDVDPAKMQNVNVPGTVGSAGAASVVHLTPGDTYDRVRDDAIY